MIVDGKQCTVHGVSAEEKKKHFAIDSWMKELQQLGAFVISLFDCCKVQDQKDMLIKNTLKMDDQAIMMSSWVKGEGTELVDLAQHFFLLIEDALKTN